MFEGIVRAAGSTLDTTVVATLKWRINHFRLTFRWCWFSDLVEETGIGGRGYL